MEPEKVSLDCLASALHKEMETLEPGPDPEFPSWESLSEPDKDFYRNCIRALVRAAPGLEAVIANPWGRPTTTW